MACWLPVGKGGEHALVNRSAVVGIITLPLAAQIVDTWAFTSPEIQERALAVAGQIRCPQCQNQSLLESNAPAAVAMRHEVFAMTEQGKTQAEIMNFMTARYGNFVRYQPAFEASTLLLWGCHR